MMGKTLQKLLHKYFHEKKFSKNIVNKRLQRSGKHYHGNWMCHGVLPMGSTSSCFLWDRGDEKDSQGGRAEHLSQGQSPSITNRSGQGEAGADPAPGIRHLRRDGDGIRPLWDISLQVGVRTELREEDLSQSQSGMAMQGGGDGAICS